ncbi:MAG: hypothetical protein ABII96_09525, partial [Candidatus Zixiibacteriota bacterium]
MAIAMVLVVSFATISAYTAGITTNVKDANVHGWMNPISKGIVYDNGMDYVGLGASQDDNVINLDPILADDFIFTADQLVNDVHWIGGYWNGPPDDGNFDWEVIFYNDFGDGTKPGAAIATYTYANADVNETFIEQVGTSFYYSYSVNLPASLSFVAGTKYWISIQGIGVYPPQSGWALHQTPILFHEAVFKSVYFGYPDWTNTSTVFGYAADMCFQLTYEEAWPDHKMHFPQLPDLIGWDVNATMPMILADDWQCSQTGWVTDIHFWGSWKDLDGNPVTDDFYTPMPFFLLSIHENIPASADTPWSRPGRLVWAWAGEIPGFPSEPPTMESWYDPATGLWNCNDHVPYWQYDFFVANAYPPADSFFQYEGQIYWLNVSAVQIPEPYQWGWKNTTDHFMDDAVYGANEPTGPWYPIVEPPRCNWFDVYFDATGYAQDMGSTNYYGEGWYRYEYWTNMWFYDNPFTTAQPKHIWMDFFIEPVGPGAFAQFAINWSTPTWDEMGMGRPPLPGEDETLFIGRQIFEVIPGPNTIDFTLPFNPEWVSVDFFAGDVIINGWIWHECVGTSLDLAFVITGHEGEPPIKCGDVNNDGVVDVGDVVYMINYLYRGGPAPVPLSCV